MIYELSYANFVLYNDVLPVYDPEARKEDRGASAPLGTRENPIKADDPKNAQMIRDIIRGYRH